MGVIWWFISIQLSCMVYVFFLVIRIHLALPQRLHWVSTPPPPKKKATMKKNRKHTVDDGKREKAGKCSVGATRKVSPNWSQETMTCHSSHCFSIVGVREMHQWWLRFQAAATCGGKRLPLFPFPPFSDGYYFSSSASRWHKEASARERTAVMMVMVMMMMMTVDWLTTTKLVL